MTEARARIIHVASGREWRGGQRQVALLARELARLGTFDQIVITTAGSELERAAMDAGVATRGVNWRTGLSFAALRATVSEARNSRAILHAHDGHAVTIAALASRFAGRPFVATKRTAVPLRRPFFWRRAAKVIAVSAAVEKLLIAGGLDPRHVAVIHSGIDTSRTQAAIPGTVRRDLGLPDTGPIAAVVGALTPEKGHGVILQTAARLRDRARDLHWVFAGTGPLSAGLQQQARDLAVTPIVHFVGHLSDPLPLVAAATVFVSASTHEGLGTGILEAMGLGTPVVATNVGGVPELLGGGAGLLVPAGNSAELGDAVLRFLEDGDLRQRTVKAARIAALKFDAGAMADTVALLYRSLNAER
ncbi:MAG: glycosyltransferase [Gemmatimonadota bacterium]